MDRRSVGSYGEEYAAAYLTSKGYTVRDRNIHSKAGEIDIICIHDRTIIAVEVKTRMYNRMGDPSDSVNTRKIAKIMRTFAEYLWRHPAPGYAPRIDVISIVLASPGKVTQLRHFKNITF